MTIEAPITKVGQLVGPLPQARTEGPCSRVEGFS